MSQLRNFKDFYPKFLLFGKPMNVQYTISAIFFVKICYAGYNLMRACLQASQWRGVNKSFMFLYSLRVSTENKVSDLDLVKSNRAFPKRKFCGVPDKYQKIKHQPWKSNLTNKISLTSQWCYSS